ncbi:MAG: hypothetical protein R6X08_06770 [Desulfosalsimonadaceae bacterium]
MSSQLPALIIVVPLFAALVVNLAGWVRRSLCFPTAVCALAVAWLSAIAVMVRVIRQGDIIYRMAGWDPPWGISWRIDHLNAVILILIATVALINIIATRSTAGREFSDRLPTI